MDPSYTLGIILTSTKPGRMRQRKEAQKRHREDTGLLRVQVLFGAQLYGLSFQSPNNHILSLLSNIITKQMQNANEKCS